jgi:hypothetical protein
LLLAIAVAGFGQDDHRHSFTVGGGAGFPLFSRSRSIWEDGVLFRAGYGFRFQRHWQTDVAYTRVFSPADKQFDPLEPVLERRELGGGRIDSYLFGGRMLFPVRDRLLVSAGIGAVHERFRAPRLSSGPVLDETGWGAYVLGSVSWVLDARRHFRIGVTPRLEIVQARSAWLRRNRWLMLPFEFGFSF